MLITINKDLEENIAQICATGTIAALRGLTNLLQSQADQRHLVAIPQNICRILEDCARLSEEQRGVAKKIRARYPELAQLKNILPTYATVVAIGEHPFKEGGFWRLPLNWIAKNGLSETHLVCEDLYDCDICQEAARDYLNAASLPQLMLRFDQTPGGGGNTHRVLLNKAVEGQRICICLVDSDRSNPSSGLGQTAENCSMIKGEGLYEVCMTPGREIENHIPVKIIDKIRSDWEGATPSQSYTRFNQNNQQILLFADLKRG